MTISTQVFNSSYTGNGLQKTFNINFPFDETPSRIQVFLDNVLQSSGYTVEDAGPNWIVSFIVAPASGVDIDIIRNTPITQDMDYVAGDDFPAESHEAALDKLTMIIQEVNGRTGSSSGGGGLVDGSFGDISVSGGGTVMTINPDIVTFDKMQNIGIGFMGRNTGSGDPLLMTPTQATALLDLFTAVAKGLVPVSPGGASAYLRADGSWAVPSIVPVWGSIIGSITDQTDLIAQLNAKSNTGHTHVANDITDATAAGKAMLQASTAAAQTALLSVFGTGTKGLVPSSPGGSTQYLRADGGWFTPSVSGGATLADGDYGDIVVSSGGTVMTIDTDVVTNAKLANMAANTVKGAITSGDPVDLSQTQLTSLINQFTSTLSGAVPASGGGTANYLRADGAWAPPAIAWGGITGLLSNQTDLNTALGGKQASDAFLTSIAALGTAADRMIYTTGIDTAAETILTSLARTLLDDTTQGAMQTTLGLAIGTNVQAFDADLNTIAGLTATTNNIIQSVSSAWASRTPTQVTATLDAMVGDSGSGGTKGLVPAPAANDTTANKFLKADGTWKAAETLGEYFAINAVTASFTLALTDKGKLVTANHASVAIVITVPPNSSVAFPVNSKIDLASLGAAVVSVAAGAGVMINSSGGKLKLTGQYSGASLTKIATDTWLLVGDLTT